MNEITYALIDDDKSSIDIIAASLKTVFQENGYESHILKYTDPYSFLDDFPNAHIDLIFCDIEMPHMDGITLMNRIEEEKRPDIIFLSNREDMVFESLSVHPFGFVRKKNFLVDISKVVKAYLEKFSQKNETKLSLKSEEGKIYVNISDIVYIESVGRKQKIYLNGKSEPLVVEKTMNEFYTKLHDFGFIQTHKAFLVNYKYIYAILKDIVKMKNGAEVYLSRRKATEVKEEYMKLLENDNQVLY